MPVFVWILIWAVIIGSIAFITIREIRSGRKGPADFDRMQHEAVRESRSRAHISGPNGNPLGGG